MQSARLPKAAALDGGSGPPAQLFQDRGPSRMITAIRRLVTSKVGAGLALVFLAFVGLAFALSDVNSINTTPSVATGNVMAVGDRQVSVNALRARIKRAYDQAAAQQPGLTMAQFLAGGQFDRLVEETGDFYALEQYARAHGISIDKVAIDASIARNPAFAGLTGGFDQATYEGRLREAGMTDAQLRDDMSTDAIVRQLIAPFGFVPQVPQYASTTYASLLLEQREGQATFVPSSVYAPTAAPTDAQLTAFFTAQRARYTIPERRVLRYALLTEANVGAVAPPTTAEIQAEYTASAANYTAQETRRFKQVIAGTRAVADRVAAAVRGGQSIDAAATASGLTASVVTGTSEAQFASGSTPAAARAAFAAAQGALVAPQQVPLGWLVLQVEEINRRPARSLAEATPELTTIVAARKQQEAMIELYNSVQESLNSGATVSEVARDKGLQLVTTPALLATGVAPGNPGYTPDAMVTGFLANAFQAHDGDPAQIVEIEANKRFALVEVAETIAAAPPALSSIRDRVVTDWRQSEGAKRARDLARRILASVEGGQSLSAAATAAGVSTSVQTIGGRRINMRQGGQRVPPEIELLFSMPVGSVKTLELPGNVGWMVIHLKRSIPGDAAAAPELIQQVAEQLREPIGGELVEAIVAAARAEFPVEIDQAALARLRAEMTGTAAPDAN